MYKALLFSAVVVFSWLLIYGVRLWAERCQIIDIPNERSSHTNPTPRGGGLGIVIVCSAGWLLYAYLGSGEWQTLLPFSIGALLVAGISWIDDLRSLPNWLRFAVHSLVAMLALINFGYWDNLSLPLIGELHIGWFGVPVTFIWIVGLINAYNFMDGIDGIAGGQAVVAATGWAVVGWLTHQPLVVAMGLLLAASSLGFLFHNWSPARIFMGDVGSAFLGYTFAVLPVIEYRADPRAVVVGILLLWPFLFDSTFTFLRRLRNGENVFAAHRSHLYQRLVIIGYSHARISLLYIGLALIGLALALARALALMGSQGAIILALPLMCFALWFYVIRAEQKRSTEAPSDIAMAGEQPRGLRLKP
jgi:UDP-N-acetylmuramyl pentapeptide phosphotransferase/UDP-N-acetylglucosamine-1-phosphate transferase